MIQPTSPIQGPSADVIEALQNAIEGQSLHSGPAFCYDQKRCVFLMAVVECGVIIHWQIEPARNEQDAMNLRNRYLLAVTESIRQTLERLPGDQRAAVAQHLEGLIGDRTRH